MTHVHKFHPCSCRYKGSLEEESALKESLEKGLASDLFIELVYALSSELKQLCSLQETVSRPQGPSDAESFQLEMRSFLQEMSCPHESLLKELDLLSTLRKKLLLVDFLLSELLAARMIAVKKKKKERVDVEDMEVDGAGGGVHSVQANLEAILRAYGINTPPPHVTPKQIFDRIIGKVL